jgi:uncharacterized protein
VSELLARPRYKASRFNLVAWSDGSPGEGDLLAYNSFSSAFLRLGPPVAAAVAALLEGREGADVPDGVVDLLLEQGILVDRRIDELAVADRLQEAFRRDRSMHLIVMPTEKCNFRCVYCYETFAKGRMSEGTVERVATFVQRRARELDRLHVDWFGGEPLTALSVVEELSDRFLEICRDLDVEYSSSMTTNGYLLSADVARSCLDRGVTRFQVTLDGTPDTHNKLRVLANGNPTFDTIVANLRTLQSRPDTFDVRLRVNFTPDVVRDMPRFLGYAGGLFGDDPRFSIQFHPVGQWGGPHDDQLETCERQDADQLNLEFLRAATESGFSGESWRQSMRPFGSSCYAADPKSLVIGSDGAVYKCTVAFQDPRNMVGSIDDSGTLELDDVRMGLWTRSGAEADDECRACAFRPACQGNMCPLDRMLQDGKHTCPPAKRQISQLLPLLALRPGAPSLG